MRYFVDFLNELKKGIIAPVYLLFGPEDYMRAQAVLRLKEYILPPDGEQLSFDLLDGSSMSGREIVDAASSASLLPGKRLVLVRDPQILLAKAGSAGNKEEDDEDSEYAVQSAVDKNKKSKADKDIISLLDYLAAPNPNTCLVFDTGKNVDKRKKIYKETARLGRVLECVSLKPYELMQWLAKQAKEGGCSLDRRGAEELLARCGRDMNALYNEMQKLTSYAKSQGMVNQVVVKMLTAPRIEDNIFDVVDAIGERQCLRALSGIRDLLLSKEQPQSIIGMVARQFRLILQVQGLTQKGYSREQIIALLKMHPFVYSKIVLQRNNFSQAQLIDALTGLMQLDKAIKSGQADFYPAMETFIIKVCS